MTENVLQSDGQADLQVDTRFLQATKKQKKTKDRIKQMSILRPLAFVMVTNSSLSKQNTSHRIPSRRKVVGKDLKH